MSYVAPSTLENHLLHIPMIFLNLSKQQVWYHCKANLNLSNTSVSLWRENTSSKFKTGNKNYFWNIIFFFSFQWDPATSSWEWRNKKNPANWLTIISLSWFSVSANWGIVTTRDRHVLSLETFYSWQYGFSNMLHYFLLVSGLWCKKQTGGENTKQSQYSGIFKVMQFHFWSILLNISFNFTLEAIVRDISDVSNMQVNCMYTHVLETPPICLPVKKECLLLRIQPLLPESLSKYFLQVQEV